MAMAANQTLPGLQVTAPEEDMEISDYERTADDIDIDIDISVEPIREEDDYMVDDRSEHENKDDIMLDSDGQEDEDGMMQDNFSVPDEHLTDASDVGYGDIEVKEAPQEAADTDVRDGDQVDDFIDYDDNVTLEPKEEDQLPMQQSEAAPPMPPNAPENSQVVGPSETGDASFQQAAENSTASHQVEPLRQGAGPQGPHTSEDTSHEQQTDKDVESSDMPANPSEEPADKSPVGASQESHVTGHQPETDANAPEEAPKDQEAPEECGDQNLAQSPKNVDSLPVPEPSHGTNQEETRAESLDGAVNLTHEKQNREEQQSTSTHSLHPVVVVYNEEEISLFPPSDGDTSGSYYFLQDEELAHGSIRSLLDACRQVLGDTVQHEDELEIDVAELGLRVSEESLDAAQCTFAQVLDAYIQLHRNDGVENPGPLYVALSTRTKFSARLESIMKVVSDGKGMSQLPFPDYAAEEEPHSDSPDHHQQESEGHAEESGRAPDAKDAANVSARGSLGRERDDDLDSSVSQGQEAVPSSVQSTGAGADLSSADTKPEENLATDGTHYLDIHEAGEEPYADELPEYNSEDENTTHAGDSTGMFATGDFSAASHPDQSDLDDVHKGDDGESHGSSTVRGDNTPATTEHGTLANSHAAEPAAQHPQTETESFVETVDVQEFGYGGSADVAGQEGNDGEENENAEEHEPHVDEDGYAGEENEGHGNSAQGFDQSGYVGREYEYAEDDPNPQQHDADFNDQEEQFDLPSDDEHDGYDDQGPQAVDEKTHVQEKGNDSNEAEFADQEAGEYVVVENEDVYEEGDPEANDHDGRSSHDDQSDDAYANQTAENNEDATLVELEADAQRIADDQHHPASPIGGGVDDDTIDYDDEELSRQSEEEASTAEGVAASPSSFKRTWEEFDHGEKTADNDQALKKVKSG
ncbi:hypothetical protein BKA80DRAFT_312159 [Phyllosticta citrichinensis]